MNAPHSGQQPHECLILPEPGFAQHVVVGNLVVYLMPRRPRGWPSSSDRTGFSERAGDSTTPANSLHSFRFLSIDDDGQNNDNSQFQYGIEPGQVSARRLSALSGRLTLRYDSRFSGKQLRGSALGAQLRLSQDRSLWST